LDAIRLATMEEVEAIKDQCDLGPEMGVVTFGGKEFAVIRKVTEIDPVIFAPNTTDQRKFLFMWGMENHLRLNGVSQYYFNIAADDEKWRATAKRFGAEETSGQAEVRYTKVLL
jgi:hypothetical protein